jgi:hypothetical protein
LLGASSYLGGRDQEDHVSNPAWANSSQDPISKKTHHKKRSGGVAQGVSPGLKPQKKKTGKRQTLTNHYRLIGEDTEHLLIF